MNQAIHRIATAILAFSVSLLLACGGQSAGLPGVGDSGDTGACLESVCPQNQVWNQASCQCESLAKAPVADAAITCPPIQCPSGSVQGLAGGQCACLPVDAGIAADSKAPTDARVDVSLIDAPSDSPRDVADVVVRDVSSEPPPDVYYYDTPYCDPTQCGPGSIAVANSFYCQCIACTNSCPSGQTPAAGCGGCTDCSQRCPAGFVYGSGCNCGPPGTDAGPNIADGGPNGTGGTTCLLQGYTACSAGSWCQLGTCPDGTTQYGCYCNPDGTANCDVSCPIPPPCMIPGQGSCPYGSQCVYGDCTPDVDATALVCSCSSQGSASCFTSSCGNFVTDGGVDGADGGVTCLLEGYVACSAGSFCQLGTCPDNTTPYGCTCNADGTANCRLTCPPAICTIPGEGTCPLDTTCTFGSCNGSSGTMLECYCSGGSAYCNTISCAEAGLD